MLLLLVGLGGFVIANHDDNLNKKTFAADYKALGKRNADTAAKALDFRVRKVNAAYSAYVAAELTVRTRHEAVTNQFNEVVSPLDPLLLVDIANARQHLPQVIAKYGAALKQERATRQAYVHQLALLKAQVAK